MKGAAASLPGQVIIADFPEPEVQDQDVVLQTLACGICATDVKLVQKGAPVIKYALGHELAGKIIQAPMNGRWDLGQRVVVAPYLPCGQCYYCRHGQPTLCGSLYNVSPFPGGLAERIRVPEELVRRGMFPIPEGMTDGVAALAEPLGCVIKGLEDSCFSAGDSLLVIGDGPMGQLAAAAGKALGGRPVIVAGMTDHRLDCARKYFADYAIDVTCEDLKTAVADFTGKRGADVVIVAVSSAEALLTGINNVRAGGTVNAFAGVPEGNFIELDVRQVHYQQYHLTGSFGTAPRHMARALELLQNPDVDFSKVVSASYLFPHVGEAVAYVEQRRGLKAMVTFTQAGELN